MSTTSVLVESGTALDLALAPVLASLPDDFVATAPRAAVGDRGVVVVDGSEPHWPASVDRALPGAAAIMVRGPVAPEGREAQQQLLDLAGSARSHGVPVVLERRWSSAPGVFAFAGAFAEEVTGATAVSILLVEDAPRRSMTDALLDGLGLARAAGAPALDLGLAHHRPGSWAAWGRTAFGALLHLQGVHAAVADGAVLTASSSTMWARVHVPDTSSAAPATARCADQDGERLLPTEYEAGSRATWRRLHAHLAGPAAHPGGAAAGDELEALALDLAVLASLPQTL